jgi:hypothetical protein
MSFRIIKDETAIAPGRSFVCVETDARDELQDTGFKKAQAFATEYMIEQGQPTARVSSSNGPYPAGEKGTTDNQIGNGVAGKTGWRVVFKFMSMP